MKIARLGIGVLVSTIGLLGLSALPAAAVDNCSAGHTCRWKDHNYTNCRASSSIDNNNYDTPIGNQDKWDTCAGNWISGGINDAISSVTNHGNSCWITFYKDSGYSGGPITFARINTGFTYADLDLAVSNTGYNGAGSGVIGGPYNTASRNDMISSHDFCS
jgi:hypothetical protein